MLTRTPVAYGGREDGFEGLMVADTGQTGPRPVVLVFHTIRGRTEFEEAKAQDLAHMGYIGFAVDLYGGGKTARSPEECRALMDHLNADRPLLLERIRAALDCARGLPGADTQQVAAIGFCFGGKCVLDLARSGADVAAVASFHGLYDPPGTHPATPIASRVLVLHGWDDPLAPPESVLALGQELTRKGAHWELIAYGHTGHAFTNPQANHPDKGLLFNPVASERAWARMLGFFEDAFQKK